MRPVSALSVCFSGERSRSEPLSKIDRITLVNTGSNGDVGISRMTEDVVKVIAQVPPVIESLTGLKIDQLIQRVRATDQDGGTALPGPTKP